jgi:AcrR family transcriptional regulator
MQTRGLRADAERNRRRLLDAAAHVFAEQGLDASVAVIAQRAEVGQGTLFRRFPSKDDLIAAVFVDRLTALAEVAESGLAEADSGSTFRQILETACSMHAGDRFLREAAERGIAACPEVKLQKRRLTAALAELVTRAQADGALRADLSVQDIPFLINAVASAAGPLADAFPDLWRRYLAIVLDGLRPGCQPLPLDVPTPRAVERALGRLGCA